MPLPDAAQDPSRLISAEIDGRPVGILKSEGIAHPTKRMLRLSVPRNAAVDDVKIRRKKQ